MHTGAVALDFAVIVLTGGTGARLGGADKATLPLSGSTPLTMIVEALPDDIDIVIAGRALPLLRAVTFRREEPPGGGPVAGIAAAVAGVQSPIVGVLAVDMPWSVPVLMAAMDHLVTTPDVDVIVPIDRDGRRQPLCSAWRTERLVACLPSEPHGSSLRDLLARAVVWELTPEADNLLDDIDTPEDLDHAIRRIDP